MEPYHLGKSLSIARLCRMVGDQLSLQSGHGGPHQHELLDVDEQVLAVIVVEVLDQVPLPILLVHNNSYNNLT